MTNDPPNATPLLPCPFCGSEDVERVMPGLVACNNCSAEQHGDGTTEGDARSWNTRHTATPDREGLIAKLEVLRDGDCSHAGGEIWALNKAIAIIRQDEAAMGTEQVQSDAKLNLSSEISVVDEGAMQKAYAMFLAKGQPLTYREIRPIFEDYEKFRLRKPVSVDLDDVALWKEHKQRQHSCISHYEFRKIVKTVLDAAGVKYVD